MADTHDRHGSLNVTLGLKAELQAMSDDIGIEVTSVERAYEPEYQAEAIDREGEAGAIGIQKRERWAGNYDVTGSVIDEAKFLALKTATVGGVKFIVTGNKIGDKVREFSEGSCTLISKVKIT